MTSGAVSPDEQTFLRSRLDWTEPDAEPHATLLRLYRQLIALRRHRPELSDPRLDRLRVDIDERRRTMVLHRGTLRVVVNLGTQPVTGPLDDSPSQVLLASGQAGPTPDAVLLTEESFAVVALDLPEVSGRACAAAPAR